MKKNIIKLLYFRKKKIWGAWHISDTIKINNFAAAIKYKTEYIKYIEK